MKHLRAILRAFDSADLPVAVLVLGLLLIGYGAEQLHDGLGFLICGALTVLYARPASRWIR